MKNNIVIILVMATVISITGVNSSSYVVMAQQPENLKREMNTMDQKNISKDKVKTESTSSNSTSGNRLSMEKSPYLLQHADNPVDWFPWGDEAFDRARKLNKPVFLSIGYSTCHWCHVMEHESFENNEIAGLMNDSFICVKVDREERPDIDNIYMTVCQMLTRSGGWPLTIIMTPDKKPFFAGTYFPSETRYGRIGMRELIARINDLWSNRPGELLNTADKITESLQKITIMKREMSLDKGILDKAAIELSRRYDPQYGGFSHAPKFPTPHNMLFLLRYWKRTGDASYLDKVKHTLEQMRRGGIYDHLGYGFHRYSTDEKWLVPHFEKMLYDQALLAMVYIETYQITKNQRYRETAEEIFAYVLRDMTSPEGGFYSAEDADSEGEEGKYYVWNCKELADLLTIEEMKIIERVFNITEEGNFIEQTVGHRTGANILHRTQSWKELSMVMDMPEEELRQQLETIRVKLLRHRKNRVHPSKDDKIMVDWNGLMIAALAQGSRVFNKAEYLESARKAADFILDSMRDPDGRLFHRYRDGQVAINGYLDDYSFLSWGLLEMFETTQDVHYVKMALQLNEVLLNHFWDEKNHGFYFTPDDGEELIMRTKEIYDGAIPSGNSVAMLNMLKLSAITGRSELEKRTELLINAFTDHIHQAPTGSTQMLVALDYAFGPSYEVVIAGKSGEKDVQKMLHALHTMYLPNKVTLFKPMGEETPEIVDIAEFTRYHDMVDDKSTAYVCRDHNCQLPTTDLKEMIELLGINDH